ncbi:hypothetical protein PVAP13_4KG049400 [Panicum virgatum]|uniref:Uncharacterized protein n=1 Tax=Panicum virgatum TaxID=38727 RepID=A0A8T0TKA5_PANVG|nr:hypothetical protein PVAP13_4KG049400 [Panicum virgatum]
MRTPRGRKEPHRATPRASSTHKAEHPPPPPRTQRRGARRPEASRYTGGIRSADDQRRNSTAGGRWVAGVGGAARRPSRAPASVSKKRGPSGREFNGGKMKDGRQQFASERW